MKRLVLGLLATILISTPVFAAKSTAATTATVTGNDISFAQCGTTLPKGQLFGIVGINGGRTIDDNPCLTTEMVWANSSAGTIVGQPKVGLYLNTGNPGAVTPRVASWPNNNIDPAGFDTSATNTYGACSADASGVGLNSLACSWQYGWNRSVEDIQNRFTPSASAAGISTVAASHQWWLDVETANSWETDTSYNRADLEGMVDYFRLKQNLTIGLYSTSAQWAQIGGTVDPNGTSSLKALPNWRPGASSLAAAKSNCTLAPLTVGGHVLLAQYVSRSLDYDWHC